MEVEGSDAKPGATLGPPPAMILLTPAILSSFARVDGWNLLWELFPTRILDFPSRFPRGYSSNSLRPRWLEQIPV